MASPAQRQHPFWDLVPLELFALAPCVVFLLVAPLSGADSLLYETLLGLAGNNAPSTRVAVVLASPEALRERDCSKSLPELVGRARAERGLLLEPLSGLCASAGGEKSLATLDEGAFVWSASGRVTGLSREHDRSRTLDFVGERDVEWIAPRPWRSVPTLHFGDLIAGRISASLLERRTVVFALTESARVGAGGDPGRARAAEVGAALAAVLEDSPRRTLSALSRLVWGVLLVASMAAAGRKIRSRFVPGWLPWALGAFSIAACLAGAFGLGWLVPLPTLALAMAGFAAITNFPVALAARRARAQANRLLEDATRSGPHAGPSHSDAEFWSRLSRRAEQAHPVDGVLVAELPPFGWRLSVWPNGDLTESIIRERRRDVRRTPYVDEAGGRRAKVVDGFLVMNGVPVVFAPLEEAGELEGYLFLVGKSAAEAFVEQPRATLGLAAELARLIRRRRLERLRADEWRRPLGMLVENPGKSSEAALAVAKAASDDLELYGHAFGSASVGLAVADAFGDVRMLGRAFAELARPLGVNVPEIGDGPTLEPGRLSMSRLLGELSARTGRRPPSLSDVTADGISFDVPIVGASEHRRVELRRLESRGELSGFLLTLMSVEHLAASSGESESIQRMPERGDPLVVFSLAELVTDAVAAIARDTRVKLRFQTPRVTGHAIGHRRELTDALVKFLLDAAAAEPGSPGPVITLRERRQWVEITFMDLKLGVPEPAMERTVLAPSAPPPGLEPLARFIQAVEDSHGYVRVRGGTTWGVKLTLGLVRARPRFESSALGRLIRISEAPLGKRK